MHEVMGHAVGEEEGELTGLSGFGGGFTGFTEGMG